ncbi:hypothetical protein KXV55_005849 [Aspergillus fumigatus]|nr:hypothetical protein KXV55_005849 [Aspergillus fumigatus]
MANKIQVTVSVDITDVIDNACEASQQTYVNGHRVGSRKSVLPSGKDSLPQLGKSPALMDFTNS